jgi:hypothetical protein
MRTDLIAEGRAQARLEAIPLLREHVCIMIRARFGVLPVNIRQQIEALSDLDEFHSAFQHAETVANLEDFHVAPQPTLRPTTPAAPR